MGTAIEVAAKAAARAAMSGKAVRVAVRVVNI